MLKKTMTYKSFDGETITEDFYFHMSKAEVIELELSTPGGMQKYLEEIIQSKDGKKIMATFKKFILDSYGQRSADGRRFIKSKELSDEFMQTNAYSDLFFQLCTDAEVGAAFMNGILPTEELEKVQAELAAGDPSNVIDSTPIVQGEVDLSKNPRDMTREELIEAMKAKNDAMHYGQD